MMTSTPADKVKYLNETKVAIKDAIVAKGVEVAEDATFRSYAESIAAIDTALPEQEKTLEVTENGSYEVSPDAGYVISKVTATVNVPTGGGGDIEVEPIVLTGACDSACKGSIPSQYIALFGNTISTADVTNSNYMFQYYENATIPFAINFKQGTNASLQKMFSYAEKLIEVPAINNAKPSDMLGLFNSCHDLKSIPEDLMDTWDFSYMQTYTYSNLQGIFYGCWALRSIPPKILSYLHNDKTTSVYNKPYYNMVGSCYVLDELVGIPVDGATLTSNAFYGTLSSAYRLKNFIFEVNEDGSAKTANWKSQVFSFTNYTGYVSGSVGAIQQAGISIDKQVTDDATYQALKNDPDWFSNNIAYSRYNHDSAVATINSLPDTSAYLAANGGTNTIQFKGAAGELTDGGAINTLTEEEIAVATAKGWTVTLS